jgi:hypothetical protein
MKYLVRAARRLSTAGAPRVRPAMPSRSPLAEADQRLNIDSFSAHFDLPMVPERAGAAPASRSSDRTRHPAAERPPSPLIVSEAAPEENKPASRSSDRTRHPAAERPPSPLIESALTSSDPVVSAVQPTTKSENAPVAAKPARKAPAPASPPSTMRASQPKKQAAPRDSEPPYFAEKATVPPDRPGPEVPARGVNALLDPATAGGRSPAPERSRRVPVNAPKQKRATEREPGADTAMDALSRAMSWVDGQGRRSRDAERGERRKESSSPGSQPRPGERVEARPVRATLRGTRPITHLEIGKIEVEVVPPAKPAQNAAPTQPSPKTIGFSVPSRAIFGWRQR